MPGYHVSVGIRLDVDILKEIDRIAKERGVTRSTCSAQLITESLEKTRRSAAKAKESDGN